MEKRQLSNSTIYGEYLIIYLLLLFKAGFLFCEMYSAFTSIGFLLLLIVWNVSMHRSVSQKHLLIVVSLVICMMLTYTFNGMPDFNKFALSLVNWGTVLLIAAAIPFNRFSESFSNIIFAICLCSLLGHLTVLAGLPIINLLPQLANSQGHSVYFALLAEFWTVSQNGFYRLQGIFWEPGAFQTMIIFAMLLDIYINHPNKQKSRLGVYIVTIIFTYSTTGYLCAIAFLFLLTVKGKRLGIKKAILFLIVMALVFLLISWLYKTLEGFLYFSTFGKLEMMNDAYAYGEENAASSRWESVIVPLRFFVESPIVGIGEFGLESMKNIVGHSMFTFTPINYFAYYGLICGLICFTGFFRLLNFRNKSLLESMLLISLLVMTTSSENFAFNPILSCFMLYGFTVHSNYSKRNASIRA